ncbi:MAG: lipopolysaccharide transport periplasmic protein LptA [Pseudomonadota bacterium]
MRPSLLAESSQCVSSVGTRGLLLLLCTLLHVIVPQTPVFALPDDRLQAIEISAERAIRDERAGYTVYMGDVVLEQGSLHIEADKLTLFHDDKDVEKIVAIGEPARLRQQPEADKDFVTASAGRIVYEKAREWVLLRYTAVIEQDGAVVSGEYIEYFLSEQRVNANSDQEDSNSRIQVVIPAEVAAGKEDDGDDPSPAAALEDSASSSERSRPNAREEGNEYPQEDSADTKELKSEQEKSNGRRVTAVRSLDDA